MSTKGRTWSILTKERISEMHDLYMQGNSLALVADAFDRTRQSVFELFKRYGLATRPKRKPKAYFEFNGCKYTIRNIGYYGKTEGDRTLLHRDMWEFSNGKIPEGFDIHHKDGNKLNNELSNFECISKSDHKKKHQHGQNQYTKTRKGEKCGA